jgi:hypothetical protein
LQDGKKKAGFGVLQMAIVDLRLREEEARGLNGENADTLFVK